MNDVLDSRRAEERQRCARLLLTQQLVPSTLTAEFRLINRHRDWLTEQFRQQLGYDLQVGSDGARLYKRLDDTGTCRPLRLPPRSAAQAGRSIDEHPPLTPVGAMLACLICAALDDGGTQTVFGELVDVVTSGARAAGVNVDFESKTQRTAFVDAVQQLEKYGVLTQIAGSEQQDFRRLGDENDEALYNISRTRLASLMLYPEKILDANSAQQIIEADRHYPDSEQGERDRIRHELARRLVEHPVLYRDELDEQQQTYFATQRVRLGERLEALTGLQVEHRAEGSALVARGKEMTDLTFPAQKTEKQLALLLCKPFSGHQTISHSQARREAEQLVREHHQHWNTAPHDRERIERLTESALDYLSEMKLIRRDPDHIVVLGALHRFRAPIVKHTQSQHQEQS